MKDIRRLLSSAAIGMTPHSYAAHPPSVTATIASNNCWGGSPVWLPSSQAQWLIWQTILRDPFPFQAFAPVLRYGSGLGRSCDEGLIRLGDNAPDAAYHFRRVNAGNETGLCAT